MKHFVTSLFPIAATLLMAAVNSSCIFEGEEECPENLEVTIENDWMEAPDAAPGGMAYIFFPSDGTPHWRFDFPGRMAGAVALAIGDYAFISYNDDTYDVKFRDNGRYATFEAYTADKELLGAIPRSERGVTVPRSQNEHVVGPPDMMWGCAYRDVSLGYDGLWYIPSLRQDVDDVRTFSAQRILRAFQKRLTCRYSFRIEEVKNLAGVKSMGASLSGMAGSLVLSTGVKGNYPSTLSLKASALTSSAIGSKFCTFGLPPSPSMPNILSLYVVIKDGRKFSYEFDVTDQVRTAPDPMNVAIVIKGLVLEIPESGEGTAFDVAVDGWETVIVNITE